MGIRTDLKIQAWQEQAGIEPATGKLHDLWCELQDRCFEAIKVAELEKSGIRDGDGHWYGSDVVDHTLFDLYDTIRKLRPE